MDIVMEIRAVVIFRGRVQGVYFRANCAEKAEALGLRGSVQNRGDGSVEAVFQGDRPGIEACIEWNKTSQPYASVETVEVSWHEPKRAPGSSATFLEKWRAFAR